MFRTKIALLLLLMVVMTNSAFGVKNDVTLGTSPTADITDWDDEYCVLDTACDEFPNQQDGKGACIASNYSAPGPADTAYLRYDFDDTGRTGGGNTIDGCWMVDVNQNGNADRVLCFSVSSTGGTADTVVPTLFTCTDGAGGCTGPVEVASSAACALNNATADEYQLADCDVGDVDLAVECSALLADMGWSAGEIGLLWGCSSTSSQPTSSTFDCFGDPAAPLYINPNTGENFPVELQYFEIE